MPHSEQKHHIPLSDTSQKEPHLRANSSPAPELQHLLISAKFSGIKSLWILIFLFLLEPKHDLNTQSQCSLIRRQRDSVMTAEPGCVLTWPRFHSLIAAEVELALPLTKPGSRLPAAAASVYEPLFWRWPWWAGGFIAYWKQPAGPEEKLYQRRAGSGEAQLCLRVQGTLLGSGFVWVVTRG